MRVPLLESKSDKARHVVDNLRTFSCLRVLGAWVKPATGRIIVSSNKSENDKSEAVSEALKHEAFAVFAFLSIFACKRELAARVRLVFRVGLSVFLENFLPSEINKRRMEAVWIAQNQPSLIVTANSLQPQLIVVGLKFTACSSLQSSDLASIHSFLRSFFSLESSQKRSDGREKSFTKQYDPKAVDATINFQSFSMRNAREMHTKHSEQ